jgi:tetratricopeptide (TPR) repeat protein
MAVKALAATGQSERVLPALTARLVDESRVVRARTAAALLALGYVELPGRAGQALAAAQDEYAASMQSFPDMASNHAQLGWLEASRGRPDAAQQALDRAIHIDATYPRPYIIKGVLEARAGRYQAAIDFWKKARSLDPGSPRIDELIAEAEKRKAGAR